MQELDWDSTPGCCYLKYLGSTNKEIFKWNGIEVDRQRCELVKGAVRARFTDLLHDIPHADPLNVFIKREPHKLSKWDEGKFRLISGVSLIDTMIDRVLFGWLLRVALSTVLETPCMLGWAPTRGGWRYLAAKFNNKPVTCMDKSAFDWTVTPWMIESAEQFLHELPVNAPEWWHKMVAHRFRLLYKDCVYQFPDETQVQQEFWGIQKSGCLLTLILNSYWQTLLHCYASIALGFDPFVDHPITMGDDTLQVWRRTGIELGRYAQVISEVGPNIKSAVVQHWIEFAGFIVVGNSCVPAYWKKHLFNLLYASDPVQTLQQYQVLYSHSDEMFKFLENALTKISPRYIYTRSWCRNVMDFESDLPSF